MDQTFEGKRIVITGGTGSLGQTLVRRILSGELGRPKKLMVFSRDEAKQYLMKMSWKRRKSATDDIFYHNFEELLEFRIGDVRDYPALVSAVRGADIVLNAAAMKQVPTCEYFPLEAANTNIQGAGNLVRAVREAGSVETVVGISTDKACKPINVMGMTKAVQERVFIASAIESSTRYLCVRYGNVISSRGSVVPLFKQQIASGGPVTLTLPEMTRFLLTLNQAVDTVFAALQHGRQAEIFIPRVPSARVRDIAEALIGRRAIPIETLGLRPGEKIHEILVSEEESYRTLERGNYYVIQADLPELRTELPTSRVLTTEYSSRDHAVSGKRLAELLGEEDFQDHALGEASEPAPAVRL